MTLNSKITIKCPKQCQEGWLWPRGTTRTARMIRKCRATSASQSYKAQLFHLKKKATRWSTTRTKTWTNWQSTQQHLKVRALLLTSQATWSISAMAPSEVLRGPPATTKSTSISKSNHLAQSEEKTMTIRKEDRRRWSLQVLVRIVMETQLNTRAKVSGVTLPIFNHPTSAWMNQTFLCKNEKISSL